MITTYRSVVYTIQMLYNIFLALFKPFQYTQLCNEGKYYIQYSSLSSFAYCIVCGTSIIGHNDI